MKNTLPKWLENAIFYEIYPQSFNDTNGDGIGDIPGIIEKLDYIKELGANAIWMNPCFLSPFDDAGYDVEDYYTVAPRYGTNADLVRLFHEVHKRDMHIILDLVPGHTSYKHKWFVESMKPERNEYSDRYVWTDSIWEAPDGMQTLRGISQRDGSVAVNFFSSQPALNYGYYKPDPRKKWQQAADAPGPSATREELKNIMRFWLNAGCDGFRADMAYSLVKGDQEAKGTIRLWQDIRKMLDREYPEAGIIAEWFKPEESLPAGFHMDFFRPNTLFWDEQPYFSKTGKGTIKVFVDQYKDTYAKTKGRGLMCVPSGNHDSYRIARRMDQEELKVVFAFLLSVPGAPFIYYGDEIGMRYLEDVTSVEGGYNRTGSRSPMQWDKTLNAGFSDASEANLYIPLDPASDRPDALSQMQDVDSLRSEVKRLIELRLSNQALQNTAEIEFVKSGYPFVFRRKCDAQTITVVINPSAEEVSLKTAKGDIIYKVGGKVEYDGKNLTVGGCSAVFIEE